MLRNTHPTVRPLTCQQPRWELQLAQQWVAKKLHDIAQEGVQVIVTTHSPYFIDLSRPGSTVLVRKAGEDAPTTVVQLKPSDLVERLQALGAAGTMTAENVGTFYENSATLAHKAGLFARACLLVEGPTEELALTELLGRLGVDLVRLGIAVVPVSGVTNLAKWVRYYKVHGIPVFPVFDTDSAKTGNEATQARAARQDLFSALELGTELDYDGYVAGPIGVHERFAVFDADFETALRACFGHEYEVLEATARAELGKAKPLIALFVARHLAAPPADGTSAWDALLPLAKTVADLPITTATNN
jgi:putative ATP-dependent endonuclease of OLD family